MELHHNKQLNRKFKTRDYHKVVFKLFHTKCIHGNLNVLFTGVTTHQQDSVENDVSAEKRLLLYLESPYKMHQKGNVE